jgi:hypothetical protein
MAQYNAKLVRGTNSLGTSERLATEATLQNLVGLEIPPHDYIAITYVTVGNGIGEVSTVTFKDGGLLGTTVATLTLGYDANNKLINVTKT